MDAIVLRVFLVLAAYVSGSVPIGVLVSRASGGPDPRSIGSGRTGGTNALRALGRKWAAVVVVGDLAKGALPVLVARRTALAGAQLAAAGATLGALGPGATLERGYAIVRRTADSAIVRDPAEAAAGTALRVRVARGEFPATAGEER